VTILSGVVPSASGRGGVIWIRDDPRPSANENLITGHVLNRWRRQVLPLDRHFYVQSISHMVFLYELIIKITVNRSGNNLSPLTTSRASMSGQIFLFSSVRKYVHSNLANDRIARGPAHTPSHTPSVGIFIPHQMQCSLGHTSFSPNVISIGSSVFAQLISVSNIRGQTDHRATCDMCNRGVVIKKKRGDA